ncbi:hypothetical protein D3C80_1610840 [compost metagenome]
MVIFDNMRTVVDAVRISFVDVVKIQREDNSAVKFKDCVVNWRRAERWPGECRAKVFRPLLIVSTF